MQRIVKKTGPLSVLLVVILPLLQCKEVYVSPYTSPTTGYLVVEGYISGNSETSFTLSRTIKLSADTTNPQEVGASVQVEGDDNSVYPLTEAGGGIYNTGSLPLNVSAKYRLRIHTQSGGEYLSDYVPYKITPAIDSINWKQDNSGVNIYANAHDDAGNTRYYQWSYDVTWEYNSAEGSDYEYDGNTNPVSVIPRSLADQVYRCWSYVGSSNVLISNSAKLAKDEIYEYPLNHIAADDVQLSVLYSMLVRQYALTVDGYNFLNLMKKNTESLGSIFDAQPSQLTGNIHCLSNTAEQVIGFVSAGTVQQQRIFISRSQLSPWNYYFSCPLKDTIAPNSPDQFEKFFGYGSYTPTYTAYSMGGGFIGYYCNETYCIDCKARGGSNVKPAYWPY
ncbi:MAG TPA: DUF4249 domain-containing protein [Puia sp.]|nr:DUF4249 domain-containing protein [Puia sp.]